MNWFLPLSLAYPNLCSLEFKESIKNAFLELYYSLSQYYPCPHEGEFSCQIEEGDKIFNLDEI